MNKAHPQSLNKIKTAQVLILPLGKDTSSSQVSWEPRREMNGKFSLDNRISCALLTLFSIYTD